MGKLRRIQITTAMRLVRQEQGKRLRALRHDKGESLRTVANETSVGQTSLGYAERGLRFVTQPELFLLAAYYDVTPTWVIQGGPLKRELQTPLEKVTGHKEGFNE